MKTSHVLLVGGVISSLLFREQLKTFIESKTKQVKQYAESKVSVSPYKLPKVGFSLKRRKVSIDGEIVVKNELPISATVDSYMVKLVLEESNNRQLLGETPLTHPATKIIGSGSTRLGYKFYVPLTSIQNIVKASDPRNSQQMYVEVSNLKVSGFALPTYRIAITSKWKEIADYAKNPDKLLDNLFNL